MFKDTRIKLTSSYIAIVMAITLSFSTFIYVAVNRSTKQALRMHQMRVENSLRRQFYNNNPPPAFMGGHIEQAAEEVRSKTLSDLARINILIWIFTGTVGYWFAGRTLKPIEEMTEKQKKFVEDATHELKTPITSMKTNLEVGLRNKKLTLSKSKDLIKSAIEDTDDLTTLVNELIRESKYSQKKPHEKVDLDKIIEDAIKKLNGRYEEKELVLEKNLGGLSVRGNKKSLTELITILLDNAIKFNIPQGKITVTTKKNGTITIKDTGIGISAKDIPHIFDRFYKADSSRTKQEHEGFGLGLSIAKEIVDEHKGSISVESKINKGTTFTVKL